MAKKGIKVKEIAAELGVTSRVLIDRCRAAGMVVQNSITKLSVEQARTVREWFGAPDSPDTPPATDPPPTDELPNHPPPG